MSVSVTLEILWAVYYTGETRLTGESNVSRLNNNLEAVVEQLVVELCASWTRVKVVATGCTSLGNGVTSA